jgi:VCBS repeat-containing protein
MSGKHFYPAENRGVPPAAHSVTVTNIGTAATGALTIALTGTGANKFTLSNTAIDALAVGGNDSFTVQPKTGLAVGTYTASVMISGDSGVITSFTVSFTVIPKGTISITPPDLDDVNFTFTFSTALPSLSKTADDSCTLSVELPPLVTINRWLVDGVNKGSDPSLSLSAAAYSYGTHTVTLIVMKNGVPYSGSASFKVVP